MEMLSPLVKILGEDARALRAKVTALRNTAVKGLKNYRATLEQVGEFMYIIPAHQCSPQDKGKKMGLHGWSLLQCQSFWSYSVSTSKKNLY